MPRALAVLLFATAYPLLAAEDVGAPRPEPAPATTSTAQAQGEAESRPSASATNAASQNKTKAPPKKAAASSEGLTTDDFYDAGRFLFDNFAPAEIKNNYDFPTRDQWNDFANHLESAMQGYSMLELVACEDEARAAMASLKVLPGSEQYAEWLQERIDLIDVAKQAVAQTGTKPDTHTLPYYNLWLSRLRNRPAPRRAAELMPQLRAAFIAEGVPQELAWLAEIESSFNPDARSRVGAKGLYQLMPATAKSLGLSTMLPDERAEPEKNARAAARLLRSLYNRFGAWPLALAAYNAGEGRVSRTLAKIKATTFAEISPLLPVETRLYVPRVCATILLRTGISHDRITAPFSPGLPIQPLADPDSGLEAATE